MAGIQLVDPLLVARFLVVFLLFVAADDALDLLFVASVDLFHMPAVSIAFLCETGRELLQLAQFHGQVAGQLRLLGSQQVGLPLADEINDGCSHEQPYDG